MTLTATTAIVIAANILGACMAIPQVHKLLRTRRVDGISLTWATISALVNAWWAIYAVGVNDMSILPVSVVSAGAYVVIGFCLCRFSDLPATQLWRPTLIPIVAVTSIPLVALNFGEWLAAGIVLGAMYGVQLSPAVFAVYRTVDVSGVSLATWVIGAVEAALWGLYGFASVDVGLLTLAGSGLVMSSLVLARLFVRRPRRTYLDQTAEVSHFAAA